MSLRPGLLVAALASLAALAAGPRGARAQHAAYVGCFAAAGLSGVERDVATLDAAPPAALAAACVARCASLRHPLASLQLSGWCGCASAVPDAGSAVPARQCEEAALVAAGAAAVAVFYSHHSARREGACPPQLHACGVPAPLLAQPRRARRRSAATPLASPLARPITPRPPPPRADPTERCRLSNLGPLGASNIEASYNPGRASFDGGALVLGLVGTDGARVHASDSDAVYGMWQWEVEPSASMGAVSGAYVSRALAGARRARGRIQSRLAAAARRRTETAVSETRVHPPPTRNTGS